MNFLNVHPDTVFTDISDANVLAYKGFSLNEFRTTATNPVPNIVSTSSKVYFRDCVGIEDTFIGGQFNITTSAPTLIALPGTYVKMAGITTYDELSHFVSDGNNRLKYIGDDPVQVRLDAFLSFSGLNNHGMRILFRKWNASLTIPTDIRSVKATLNGSGRAENVSIGATTRLLKNECIEVWVQNLTLGANITAEQDGLVMISKRAS